MISDIFVLIIDMIFIEIKITQISKTYSMANLDLLLSSDYFSD